MIANFIEGALDWYRRSQFTAKDRVSFYGKLALLQKNGIKLKESLETLKNIFSEGGRKPNRIKAIVAEECLSAQRDGDELSLALQDWVPYEEASTIAAGSASSKGIHESLLRAKKIVTRKSEMRKLLVKSLSYPAVLWMSMFGLLYYAAKNVMPQLIKMTKPENWDTSAQIMNVLTIVVGQHGSAVLIAATLGVGTVIWTMRNVTGIVRVYLDRVPPWSILRMVYGTAFVSNYGVLQASGIKPVVILEAEARNANPYMRERLEGALMGLKNGLNIGEALDRSGHEFPSREAIEYLRVIANLDGGPEQMMEFAEDWSSEVMEEVAAIAATLGNVSVFAIFAVMGFLLSGASTIGMQALGSTGQ
jgi:type II secretory pathway component PulF